MKFAYDRNERMIRYTIILVLFFFFVNAKSQYIDPQDSITRVSKGSLIQLKDIRLFIPRDTAIIIPANLVKRTNHVDTRTDVFYDSLMTKASKKAFTKALFELVIVKPDTTTQKKIIDKSDDRFNAFRGIRIRNITVRRLEVFGTDLMNPGNFNPNGMEKLLNETHINTNEKIIRKNLIFNEGDSISPLKLTDNERILRQLPYLDDARIIIVPVSSEEADIVVITKDVYSIGASYNFRGKTKGSFWLFDKNLFGSGHEFKIEIPYSTKSSDSPGIGLTYYMNNIKKSFVNLSLNYYNGLGRRSYTLSATRDLVSSETKYGGGIIVRQMYTSANIDTLPVPAPLHYNYQDYWLLRSFLVDRNTVTRIIGGIRFINDNIYTRPQIDPNSYYALQRKEIILGSITYSRQKFYKTSLVYGYGRTEDMPYGGLFRITGGFERNEFKDRGYISVDGAIGGSLPKVGYFQFSSGLGGFLRSGEPEQGILITKVMYVSNLYNLGRNRMRNFVNLDFTRGYTRYTDEYLSIIRDKGFTGFRNDSLRGGQRVRLSLESDIFSPVNYLGFRFVFFGFADLALLASTKQVIGNGAFLSGLGLGIRVRNNNLVFNTFQVRIGFFPNAPDYSQMNHVIVSGEQLLKPNTFDPGPPAVVPFR
jgi:hypothetical protein